MVENLAKDEKDLFGWLQNQAFTHHLTYLLVFADDDVIWGLFDGTKLKISSRDSEKLPIKTMQRVHFFGQSGELRIIREMDGFNTIWLDDHGWDQSNWIDEQYVLWGVGQATDGGFTLMQEGQQGLRHAPPIPDAKGKSAIIRLRHYINYDAQGQAYISHSRLMGLDAS